MGDIARVVYSETVDRLDTELSRQARAMDVLRDRIAAAAPADLAALRAARAERKEAWLKRGRDAEHGRARALADAAFQRSDFATVVRALEPFEPELSAAERKKLEIARSRTKDF